MRIPGADKAIANLVKWSSKEEWNPYREQVEETMNQKAGGLKRKKPLGKDSLSCGEESEVYTNTGKGKKTVRVKMKNTCEFSAYWFVEDAKGHLDEKGWRRVRGNSDNGRNGDYAIVPPGGKVVAICTLVQTPHNDKCIVSVH